MASFVPIEKDDQEETAVPTAWRSVIHDIVESVRNKRFEEKSIGVVDVSFDDAAQIEDTITSYGCTLIELPDAAWDSSVCRWTGTYWQLLVDLYTAEEGQSDLVLFVNVHESSGKYVFTVDSMHVP